MEVEVMETPSMFELCEDKTNNTSCWTCDHFYTCEKVIAELRKSPNFNEAKFREHAKEA
jgi:hypothetical protein